MKSARRDASILGQVTLQADVLTEASRLADAVWSDAAAQEFSGDAVVTFELPEGFPQAHEVLPAGALQALGLKIDSEARQELVATCEVDMHEDDVHGLVLFLVLHNDGLTFQQGKVRHSAAAGEFFVFDDRKKHGVAGVGGKGVMLGWSVPVIPTES